MISNPFKQVRRLSVGAKLAAVLVVVVFGSTLLLAALQSWLSQQAVEEHFRDHAASYLQRALQLMSSLGGPETDPAKVLKMVQHHPTMITQAGRGFRLFGLDPEGKMVVRPRDPRAVLPPEEILRHLASTAWGMVHFQREGRLVLVAFDRVPSGELILGVSAEPALPDGPLGLSLWGASVLTAAVVALVAALAAILWVNFFLSRPLSRLTAEAEQAAAGDLTPPALLPRGDELGRLSLSLRNLTDAAQVMVLRTKDEVFITGPDGALSDVNPALVAMFGLERREQMLGQRSTEKCFAHPEEAQLYLNSLWAQGYVQDFPATMRRLDGSEFEVLITATRSGDQQVRFGLIRDVTQLRRDQQALGDSEARYRRLVENAPDIIYRWSFREKRFDYISSAVAEITGHAPRRIAEGELEMDKLIHPDHWQRVRRHWSRLLKGRPGELDEVEYMIIDAAGRTRWLRDKALLVRDELGRPRYLEGIATEITERKLLEQELKQGRQMVESTLQGLPAAVMVLDREHRVVHWNRAMEGLTGVAAEQMVGSDRQWQPFYLEPRPVLADLVLDGDPQQIMQRYVGLELKRSPLIEGGLEGESFFPTLGPKGRHLYYLAAPIRDQDGKITHAVETLVDLSGKRLLERELRRLSVTDSLTGLYNQRFFYATLRREIEAAQRYGRPLSLLMADLDFFKAYNDRFGHLAGDKALHRVAQALGANVRAMDLCCRYGGEEFTVLLPHATMNEALGVAQRVREGMAQTNFAPEGFEEEIRLTMSLGLATLGPEDKEEDLVRRADGALYAAKQAGRDTVAADLRQRGVKIMARGAAELAGRD